MRSAPHTLLVVTGLQREAWIAQGDGVVTVCSGGKPDVLRARLLKFSTTRPRESGDPEHAFLDSRVRGNERMGMDAATNLDQTISGILSFGLAGGLAPHLRSGDVVIASHVVTHNERHDAHASWHAAAASALDETMRVHRGAIAGHDAVLAKSAEKIALHEQSGALAVDMESHIAAAFAREHGLPFAVIRVIGDPATRNLPALAANALTPDGNVDLPKVLGGLLQSPGQLPALIAAGIDSERAFASLRRVRRLLGPLFGFRRADF